MRRVSLDEALRLFREHSVELRLARAVETEAAGRARQARAYPNPVGSVTRETLSNGTEQTETYVLLSQSIDWPWRYASRRTAARRTAAAASAQLAADSARLVFDVKRAYLEAGAAQERHGAITLVSEVFRDAQASAQARFSEGDLSGYDLRRIRVERARYEDLLEDAVLGLQRARRTLASLLLPETGDAELGAESFPSDVPPTLNVDGIPARAVVRRFELAAADSAVAAATASVALARWAALPDVTITGGYKSQSDGLGGLFVGLALPVPLFDRRGGESDVAVARLQAAEASRTLLRRRVATDIQETLESYSSLSRRSELIGRQLLANVDDLMDIALASYHEGEMTLVALMDAAEAFWEARVQAIDLRARHWVSYYDVERAIGGFGDGAVIDQGESR